MNTTIAVPFRRGDRVTIPAGTVLRTTHPTGPWRVSRRAQTVTVHSSLDGWVNRDRYDGDIGLVHLPHITWAGTGGYWMDAQVTPELAAANGVSMPELPSEHEAEKLRLDVVPSHEDGYTDRWEQPVHA